MINNFSTCLFHRHEMKLLLNFKIFSLVFAITKTLLVLDSSPFHVGGFWPGGKQ